MFLLSTFLGIIVNFLGYFVIQTAGSLTMKILGTLRNVGLVAYAVAVLGEVVLPREALGYLVTLVGFAGYSTFFRCKWGRCGGGGGYCPAPFKLERKHVFLPPKLDLSPIFLGSRSPVRPSGASKKEQGGPASDPGSTGANGATSHDTAPLLPTYSPKTQQSLEQRWAQSGREGSDLRYGEGAQGDGGSGSNMRGNGGRENGNGCK
mmetsp:Transcript_41703/g.94145  ORF Transcript_41703/g.94145 Transcript_41703/m.94145 type:complete len:206 (+) Transcript_41703:316-933(+)